MAQNDTIRTGTESDDVADQEADQVDPDVWAFADGGEYATSWAVERVDDTTVRVEYHRHEAGLDDVDGEVETFEIAADKPTTEFAREVADADPEAAVEAARDYWEEN